MSTIRIQAHQVKVGDEVTFNGGRITRRVTSRYEAEGSTVLTYSDGWVITHEVGSVVTVVLEAGHPIAVLERMRDRVAKQQLSAHLAFLEACRDPQDDGHIARRREDKALLNGKLWGLTQGIDELRAGIEYYPGKTGA